jgi:site-specific DNA-methyltransferase (adenine-specific)
MGKLTLLDRARAAGLTVTAKGDRLVIKGPRRAEPVARMLLARKYEVMIELRTAGATSPNVTCDDEARPAEAAAPTQYQCATCEDSGEVVPDAFGDREPWPRWIERTGGNPLIHPLPCPSCRPAARPPAASTTRTREEQGRLPLGPAVGDTPPGIVIDEPDPGRMREALTDASRPDHTAASAERKAIQTEDVEKDRGPGHADPAAGLGDPAPGIVIPTVDFEADRATIEPTALPDNSVASPSTVVPAESSQTTLVDVPGCAVREVELTTPRPETKNWNVLTGDCIEVMSTMEPGSVSLIFADPPYNIGIDYGHGKKADQLPAGEYLDWCRRWMTEAKRLLTPDGSMWVLIDPRWAGRFQCILEDAGLCYQDTIIWHETFGVHRERKFGKDHRSLFWFTADPKQYVFCPDREPSKRQTKYNDKRANPAGRVPSNVWEISRVCGTFKERLPEFPTQLPLELLGRIVKTATATGDLVLDPFSGSATTGVACLELGRRYVGIEVNPEYAQRSRERLLTAAEQLRSRKEQAPQGGG